MFRTDVCPSTLAAGDGTFSRSAQRRLFNGRPVNHVLDFPSPLTASDPDPKQLLGTRDRISISGYQPKFSLVQDRGSLRLTHSGEQGAFILKPVPADVPNGAVLPANEHLTMQIAAQVYGIQTAANALVFFPDGQPAYLTKRFDLAEGGGKIHMEDFASLTGKTSDTDGKDYKYSGSYEDIGWLIRQIVPAWRPVTEQFFRLVVFNYLFSNGDAHLKNFSLIRSPFGDYVLSPAYDLLDSSFHVNDTYFALKDGLLRPGGDRHNSGRPTKKDFLLLGERLDLPGQRVERTLAGFLNGRSTVEDLIQRSFLPLNFQRSYLANFNGRVKVLAPAPR